MFNILPFLSFGTNLLNTGIQTASITKQNKYNKREALGQARYWQNQAKWHKQQAIQETNDLAATHRQEQGNYANNMAMRGLDLSGSLRDLLYQQKKQHRQTQQQTRQVNQQQLNQYHHQAKQAYHRAIMGQQLGGLRLGSTLLQGAQRLF